MSSVDTIIVWENLSVNRLLVKNSSTGEERVLHLTPEQEQNDSHFRDAATGRCRAHVSPSPPFSSSLVSSLFCPPLDLDLDLSHPIHSIRLSCLVLCCLLLAMCDHLVYVCMNIYDYGFLAVRNSPL